MRTFSTSPYGYLAVAARHLSQVNEVLARKEYGPDHGHSRHHHDGRGVVVVVVREPEDAAHDLEDVEWMEGLYEEQTHDRGDRDVDHVRAVALVQLGIGLRRDAMREALVEGREGHGSVQAAVP